jgi:hypothetical protein
MISKCISGKRSFESQLLAEDVLIELWSKNNYSDKNAPIAIYKCDDCGQFHLTSREPMNSRLAGYLSGSTFKLDREANKWLDKLKRK